MKICSVFLLFVLIFSISFANANELSYVCKVKNAYKLNDDGSLVNENEEVLRLTIGSIFSVSTDTGRITGKYVNTETATSTHVLKKGSKTNSFRSIADWDFTGMATHAFQILEIREFTNSKEKPFIVYASGGTGIKSGKCQLALTDRQQYP